MVGRFLRFLLSGLGFSQGLGFRVWFKVHGLGFRVWGFGFGVFKVFRVWSFGFWGLRNLGLGS